jgi:hypothetical protein
MGCGSGMTCWRRLRDWQAARAWNKIERLLQGALDDADKYNFARASEIGGELPALDPRECPHPVPPPRGGGVGAPSYEQWGADTYSAADGMANSPRRHTRRGRTADGR